MADRLAAQLATRSAEAFFVALWVGMIAAMYAVA